MHTRREEELTKGTNFIAVFLEDTASDPRLPLAAISMNEGQPLSQQKDDSLPKDQGSLAFFWERSVCVCVHT